MTMNSRSLCQFGEFGLIEMISRKVPFSSSVCIGIGDDAAAFRQNGLGLATADMLVEGVHFDLSYTDPLRLGRKSLAVNLSDIAAMGGKPTAFLLSLAIPDTVSADFIDDLTTGMLGMAKEFGVTLMGGDTCGSKGGLVISIALYGEGEPVKLVQRRGTSPGDLVFVTGTLGDSALGLELLQRGEREGFCIDRHLDPSPRVREGIGLAEEKIPSAMIDISDGLLSDLEHIAKCSGVGADIRLADIPVSPSFRAACGREPLFQLALGGGEDYELLFTAPAAERHRVLSLFSGHATPVTEIGIITGGSGIRVISPEGKPVPMKKSGYDHFRRG